MSAGLRPASRGSAKPAPIPSCQRERRAPQTENKREHGWSAGLRPASRGSAKPAPMTLRPANVSAAHRRPRTSAGTTGAPTSGQSSRWGPAQRRAAAATAKGPNRSGWLPSRRGPHLERTPLGEMARQARERRPPVGTAARSAAAAPTPTGGITPSRHVPPTDEAARTAWSAGLRPASRGSAKPARITLRPANVSAAPSAAPRPRCAITSPAATPPSPGG